MCDEIDRAARPFAEFEGKVIGLPAVLELCDLDLGVGAVANVLIWAARQGWLDAEFDEVCGAWPPVEVSFSRGGIATPADDAPEILTPVDPPPTDDAAGFTPPSPAASHPAEAALTASAEEASKFAPGARWTEEEEARGMEMKRQGVSIEQIAAALGRPMPGTAQKLKRLAALERENASGPANPAPQPKAAQAQGPDTVTEHVTQKAAVAQRTEYRDEAQADLPPVADRAATGAEMLGGERGGLKRHILAENDPVQAGATDKQSLTAAPAEAAPARPMWWREIEADLNALGYKNGWTPALDLALVSALSNGQPIELTEDQIGRPISECRARFIALTPNGYDKRGKRCVTMEQQERLISVLRARAEGGAA